MLMNRNEFEIIMAAENVKHLHIVITKLNIFEYLQSCLTLKLKDYNHKNTRLYGTLRQLHLIKLGK